jgi:serine/threonine protein kinase
MDPGTIIAGRFRIGRLIGEGGMGAVYEAQHLVLPRRFAIKVLRPEVSRDKTFVERFRREAIAAASVEHPNVIYITDFGATEDGLVYLVMEYLEGDGLDQLLSRFTRLTMTRSLPILAQIADALDCAHRQSVVHRDLKPENILLTEVRSQPDFVKLLDFGIAKMQTPQFAGMALTMQGQVFGTAEYMSPEQATGEPVDGRSDLYAVGCLAYEMLTGDPPFTGNAVSVLQAHVRTPPQPPSSRVPDHPIPPPLDALILRCLAKEPAQRYQTGAELRRDLLKVRALLVGMSEEIVSRHKRTGAHGVTARKKMTEGWQDLGGAVPEILLAPELAASSSGSGPIEPQPSTVTSAQPPVAEDPARLRNEYHQVLRELALALVQAALAPAETSDALERLLIIEEEQASLTGTIALSEQQFDRIRFEYGQREKRLRYAILDLNMELADLEGRARADARSAAKVKPQIGDLTFQIGELNKRCAELEQERTTRIQELAQEVKGYRDTRTQLESEAAALFQGLHSQIGALRSTASARAPLLELYQRLDELRRSLEKARHL